MPDPAVVAWLRKNEHDLYVSAITIGELRRGIERLGEGKRKAQLRVWLLALCDCMKGRILGFNTSTAHVWGQLKAKWDKAGVVVPSLDSQIAATAHRFSLTVVTRNKADFARTGVKVLNPFGH
jgi:predicted nucleic acid-binding protein